MEENLSFLQGFLKFELQVGKQLKSALIMPGVILSATFGVIWFLLYSVFPTMLENIDTTKVEIPGPAAILIEMSGILQEFGLFIFVFLGAGFYALKKSIEFFKPMKIAFDKFKLNMPIFKNVYRDIMVSRVSNALTLMLGAGVPILDALNETAEMIGNHYYKEALLYVKDEVETGRSMSIAFKNTTLFPTMFINMIKVGETSGSTDEALKNVTEFFDEEIPRNVENLTKLLEPILTVFMVGSVGFVFSSFILMMFSVADSMG